MIDVTLGLLLTMFDNKETTLESASSAWPRTVNPDEMIVNVEQAGAAELDERWSFVGKKRNQHWLWDAIAHQTGAVLAYVFVRRQDAVCLQADTHEAPGP